MKKSSGIKAKDLITTGIFTAIMFVLCMAVAMLDYMPIFIPLLGIILPLIDGIPYVLFVSKTKKFGLITIMGFLLGLLIGVMGMGVYAPFTGLIAGLLADLLLKSSDYSSAKKVILSKGIFSIWLIGNYIPIVISRDAYYQNLAQGGYGKAYADALMKVIPDWSLIPLLVGIFIAGILGALIGRSLLKKQFKRAGIA